MQDSICPKGWGLPINGNAQTSKSWINLLFTNYSLQDNDSTSSLDAQKTPLSLVYSGYYNWVDGNLYSRGSLGYFWSSTPYSTAYAHTLYFYSTRLVPQNGGGKINGLAIRCVGRQIVYKTMTLLLLLMLRKLLFPLSTPATTTGYMVISTIVAHTATSGHLHRTPQRALTTYTSALHVWDLRMATIR
ncbi:hypothetical protein IKF81_01550 [Candidatus Saccharibacteria bacterium]|nr:hypothetical protein [Candidatus Saccharibacteria bacterium]